MKQGHDYLQEGQEKIIVHLYHTRCLPLKQNKYPNRLFSRALTLSPLSVGNECTMSCHYSLLSLLLYTHRVLYLNNLQVQLDRKLNCHYLSGWQEKKVTGGRSGFCPLRPPVVTWVHTQRKTHIVISQNKHMFMNQLQNDSFSSKWSRLSNISILNLYSFVMLQNISIK